MSLAYTPPIWEGMSDEELTAVCTDPCTSPETLEEIWQWASFLNPHILGLLASNPSTPMSLLITLTERHAAKVTHNPAFRLHMSTEPGFVVKLKRRVRQNIGKAQGVDIRLLYLLGQDRSQPPSVRAAVASNLDCPHALMVGFLKHAWPVRDALARNPALDPQLIPTLAADKKADVRASVARRAHLSTTIREQLATDEDPKVRATMARRRDASPGLLGQMAAGEWVPDVLVKIIHNPRTPIEAIAPLTSHRSYRVRCAINSARREVFGHPLVNYSPNTGEVAGDAELRFRTRYEPWSGRSRTVPEWVLGTLIDFGWNRTPERCAALRPYGFLNLTGLSSWPPVADYLSEEEYFALLRGMIYAEASAGDEWMPSSVATTIFLAQSMIRMYPRRGDDVRAFLRKHAKNCHIWGIEKTRAEFTPEELEAYVAKEMVRIAAHKEAEKRRIAAARIRQQEWAEELKRRAKIQRYKADKRILMHEILASLLPHDRLVRIASDTTVTLAYFSPEWGEVDATVLDQVPPETLRVLADRCRARSSRTWSHVGTHIREYLDAAVQNPPVAESTPSVHERLSTACQNLFSRFTLPWSCTEHSQPPAGSIPVQATPASEACIEPRPTQEDA